MQLGADLRHAERVLDEVLAGLALLALMGARGEVERAREQVAVGVRDVPLDVPDQLVDEVLVALRSLDNGHPKSVLRRPAGLTATDSSDLSEAVTRSGASRAAGVRVRRWRAARARSAAGRGCRPAASVCGARNAWASRFAVA